jgi:hypothetical protein
MSLLDEVRAYAAPKATCSVPGVLASLSEDDAADLEAACDDPKITATAIEKALSRRKIHLRSSTIRRHRKALTATGLRDGERGCLCPA